MEWNALWLTFKLASITTLTLLVISLPVAYWLAYSQNRIKPMLESLFSMPLVLPPTVLGFYLLLLFSPEGFLGSTLQKYFNLRLIFSFPGLVIASIIYSLPFMIQPLRLGFLAIPKSVLELTRVLGKKKIHRFFHILLPEIKHSTIIGSILTFAHTIGEFGVVLMIGGNIPDETRVASIAIFNEVEALNYQAAHQYALILVILSFTILLFAHKLNSTYTKMAGK